MTASHAFIPHDRAAKPAGMPLSAFLTRLIWLCVLPLVLLAAWLAIDRVLTTKAEHDLEAANLAKNFATAIDQHLSARIAALNVLAVSPLADDPLRWKDLYQEAQGFHQSFGSHVILADLETRMLFNTRVPFGIPLPMLPRPKGRRPVEIAVETGMPAVSDILFGPVAGEPLVAITVPGLREGKTAFFVISTFELRQFQNRLEQVALPSGWSLALLDGKGDVIARRALPGFNSETDVDAAEHFVVKSTVSPWSVALEIPRDVYRKPLLVAAATLLAAILGATLIGVLGGLLASRRLAGAVATLTTTSSPRGSRLAIAEIEKVRERLDEAAAVREAAERDRRQSEEALRASEAALKAAQRLAGVGNWEWDIRSDAHTWSEEIYLIYGRDPALPPAVYPEVQKYFTPESWARLAAAVEKGLAEGVAYECDAEVVRPDGTHRWIVARGEATRDAGGNIINLHGTVQDITERKRVETEIHRLNAELEERVHRRTAELEAANRELESFAYAVSHDLRAPLRAMSGFSQALVEDYGERLQGEARVYLEQIGLASRKMGELIDGLLTLSRSTRSELRRDAVDISELSEHLLAELAQNDPERQVAVRVEAGLQARGDARMIEVVMRNLLGNAWKYTVHAAAPRIRVYAEERDGTRRFCVADNGAGFDMAHAGKLFQPFQRLHRQEEFPGIGIGLATVQRIVHRHGGVIEATAAPGRGATFCFSLAERREDQA